MITVKLYDNGFEVMGHANPVTCGEISALSWACANSIHKIDETERYYSSGVDNKENPNEGYTWCTFDKSNERALYIYNDYCDNLKVWVDGVCPTEVKITDKYEDLNKLV